MKREQILRFMNEALAEAEKAMMQGEAPVGCVIVRRGEIIARGANRREKDRTALGHAELDAIEAACGALSSWRLPECRMFVTLEPCPMCAGAIINARIPVLYFGAYDKKAGACGSVINLFYERFNHRPEVYGGIMEERCSKLMSDFFKNIRENE